MLKTDGGDGGIEILIASMWLIYNTHSDMYLNCTSFLRGMCHHYVSIKGTIPKESLCYLVPIPDFLVFL